MNSPDKFQEMLVLAEDLRKSIEFPQLRKMYFASNVDEFNKFCVAMDTIEDTLLALSDYFARGLGPREEEQYLRVYGVLQAVLLQQDSIRAIWEVAVAEPLPDPAQDSAWKTAREVRNCTAGHPAEVRRGGAIKRTFLTRVSLAQGNLGLIIYDKDADHAEHQSHKLHDLVTNYLSEALSILRVITQTVKKRWPPPPDWT